MLVEKNGVSARGKAEDKMMNHIMIDLETLGVSVHAPVIAISACEFDPATGKIGEQFYQQIDWASSVVNRKVDMSTIKWWMVQEDAARKEAIKDGMSVEQALTEFNSWLAADEAFFVWGNGAAFDISILETLYELYGAPVPWPFWDVRDVRTIVHLAEGIVPKPAFKTGTKHRAVDDAIHQAEYVSKMWQALAGGR